ncbi:MAG: hypothetical protein JO249_23190 [Acidobacteria bacterium]|nr:hypothetical protein [Acidobacteriota bacterium]
MCGYILTGAIHAINLPHASEIPLDSAYAIRRNSNRYDKGRRVVGSRITPMRETARQAVTSRDLSAALRDG